MWRALFSREERVRRRAAAWLARLEAPDGETARPAFLRWYHAEPDHRATFDRLHGLWKSSARLPLPGEAAPQDDLPPRRTSLPGYALAAALAGILILAAIAIGGMASPFVTRAEAEPVRYSTRIGEIRTVRLADGLTATLDTDSALSFAQDRGALRVTLEQGRARLIASRDAPVDVASAGGSVRLDAGVMDVVSLGGVSAATLIRGSAYRASAPSRALRAGYRVPFDPDRAVNGLTSSSSPDWPSGMLVFDDTPLAEAVAEANRYSATRIVLLGGADRLRVSGAHRAGDAEGFARALAAGFGLQRRQHGNLIELGARPRRGVAPETQK